MCYWPITQQQKLSQSRSDNRSKIHVYFLNRRPTVRIFIHTRIISPWLTLVRPLCLEIPEVRKLVFFRPSRGSCVFWIVLSFPAVMRTFSDDSCCGFVEAGDEPIPDRSAAAWSGCWVGLLLWHPPQRILSAADDSAFLSASVSQ